MRIGNVGKCRIYIGGREFLVNPKDGRLESLLMVAIGLGGKNIVLTADPISVRVVEDILKKISNTPESIVAEPADSQKKFTGTTTVVYGDTRTSIDPRHPMSGDLRFFIEEISGDEFSIYLPTTDPVAAIVGMIVFNPVL